MNRFLSIFLMLLVAGCVTAPPPVSVPAGEEAGKSSPARRKISPASPAVIPQQNEVPEIRFDNTPIEIRPDEILIVGRVRLSPPLAPEEMMFEDGRMATRAGKAVMVRSILKQPLPAEQELSSAETFETALDRDFLLTLPHEPVALLGGYLYISGERGLVSSIQLPGNWQLGIREEDHAVYIGTIHYIRSEYDTILGYIIEDNYPQAYEAYQHRLEEGIILRKELVEAPWQRE